jgi:uncharacterized phiE125 gp8 family phage protein
VNYKVITPASIEPVTLAEARSHLRIDAFGSPPSHPDDDYIEQLISVSREWLEDYLRRALATKTIDASFDSFDEIEIPFQPVQSITSIKYQDVYDVEQTVATTVYKLDTFSGNVVLKYNQTWPSTYPEEGVVKVRAVVGYTTGQSPDIEPMPFPIKAAMLLIIGNLYENRQQDLLSNSRATFNSLPMGVYNLIQPYRLGLGM